MSYLPYQEPDRNTLLAQSSFILLLNIIDCILNHALYCGLLGQILLGIAFGIPGGNFIGHEAQQVIAQLGYIGLILLVYEGGLSVPLASAKANIGISIGVALTGITVPIGLSFILQPLLGASPLQAYAAGAALCATSLGTVFTVLKTSELANTRMGSVLSTAAMLDDVVGLVMVQVISNLGSSTSLKLATVVRSIAVSLGFVIFVPLLCRYALRPMRRTVRGKWYTYKFQWLHSTPNARFLQHVMLLFGLTAAASYSGTSALFTAYIAGAIINWWDSETFPDPLPATPPSTLNQSGQVADSSPEKNERQEQPASGEISNIATSSRSSLESQSGIGIYHAYMMQPVNRVLRPFFFASIGFSIPISSLFHGPLLWRGILYTVLMILGKLCCGLWLVRFPLVAQFKTRIIQRLSPFRDTFKIHPRRRESKENKPKSNPKDNRFETKDDTLSKTQSPNIVTTSPTVIHAKSRQEGSIQRTEVSMSLYPGIMLGCAMVARGEIGFLISATAESNGICRNEETSGQITGVESDMFVTVTWAIFLCTFLGPIAVGLIVRRVKSLERAAGPGRRKVLGSWGVE